MFSAQIRPPGLDSHIFEGESNPTENAGSGRAGAEYRTAFLENRQRSRRVKGRPNMAETRTDIALEDNCKDERSIKRSLTPAGSDFLTG